MALNPEPYTRPPDGLAMQTPDLGGVTCHTTTLCLVRPAEVEPRQRSSGDPVTISSSLTLEDGIPEGWSPGFSTGIMSATDNCAVASGHLKSHDPSQKRAGIKASSLSKDISSSAPQES